VSFLSVYKVLVSYHLTVCLPYSLAQKQDNVHAALCDSINTPLAVQEMLDLISQANKYAASKGNLVNIHVLEKVAKWTTSMLKVFGVADNGAEIGFGATNNAGAANVRN
jgi:cysteinyl-tRNA synthetase